MSEGAVGVSDSTGFGVFLRHDGNFVVVREDGSYTVTKGQPMAVRF